MAACHAILLKARRPSTGFTRPKLTSLASVYRELFVANWEGAVSLARIKISGAGVTNLRLTVQQALEALSNLNIDAEAKLVMYYAIVTVTDEDCESAITLLHKVGIPASLVD